MADTPKSFVNNVRSKRQGERMISLSDIVSACQLTHRESVGLDQLLKEHAAEYWLREGGDPKQLRYPGGERVLQLSLQGSTGITDPAYSQRFFNEMISKGVLAVKPGLLDSPFFHLPAEEQKAIMDGLAKNEPLPAVDAKTSARERLAINKGLKDEVFR